ncbi:hypothetical protein SCALM49S_04483 [Streptomyces californicus]
MSASTARSWLIMIRRTFWPATNCSDRAAVAVRLGHHFQQQPSARPATISRGCAMARSTFGDPSRPMPLDLPDSSCGYACARAAWRPHLGHSSSPARRGRPPGWPFCRSRTRFVVDAGRRADAPRSAQAASRPGQTIDAPDHRTGRGARPTPLGRTSSPASRTRLTAAPSRAAAAAARGAASLPQPARRRSRSPASGLPRRTPTARTARDRRRPAPRAAPAGPVPSSSGGPPVGRVAPSAPDGCGSGVPVVVVAVNGTPPAWG